MRFSEHSSEKATAAAALGRHTAPVVVIEGMPGAGKTMLLNALAADGHAVLPEYTTRTGALLTHGEHPDHTDEHGHLENWIRKTEQLRRHRELVLVDRDWLTALAWSASTSGLNDRASWVHQKLACGNLVLPDYWIILDLPVTDSLQRRAGRLDPGHPWSDPAVLHRLRGFYHDPARRLASAHALLATTIEAVPVTHLDATNPTATLTAAALAAIRPA